MKRLLQKPEPLKKQVKACHLIQANLLEFKCDAICEQSNCLSIDVRGLAFDISRRFKLVNHRKPDPKNAKIACERDRSTPGTISISSPPDGPHVVHMFAQWEISYPGKYNRARPPLPDTVRQREIWFDECLTKLKEQIVERKWKSIAFPYKIGCGLAKGNWSRYRAMIEKFAASVPECKVNICQF